jgi:hypothetical protein
VRAPPPSARGGTRTGDDRPRQIYAKAKEVLQPFDDSSLCDPETSAGEAKTPGGGESAPCFGIERRERPLCVVELALMDQHLDEQSAVHDAVHRRCGELGRGKRRSGISFRGAQIATSQSKPASIAQANGEPATVSGHPSLRDRGIEERPQLRILFGQEKRERGMRKPRCEREPWPPVRDGPCTVLGQQRSGREVGAGLGGLIREDGDERG